ncbi:MAG: glycosyltransferase family 39 protein [Elusimicrobia bacterium]|nr:glycosyltransferase family 39 protein [Elusimicrobiota bacterium]
MRRAAPAAAAAAFLTAACSAVWFIRRHGVPPSFDEAWYLEVSFRFWHALSGHGPRALASEWAGAFRFKAPLLSLLPLPLYAVLGPSFKAAMLCNIPALGLLAAALYGLGQRFFSPAAGTLAAALTLFMPLTAALSRTFFVETWLTALVAAFLWRWAESDTLRRDSEAPVLGAILGTGLLCKVLFPLPLLGPVALTLLSPRRPLRELGRPLKVIAAVGAALALTWYAPNLLYIAGYMYKASFGDIAAHYGSSRTLAPSVVLPYWNALARDGASWFVLVPLAAVLAALGRRAWQEPGLRFAAAWALPPLLITTAGIGKDPRFAAPALPALALALAGALDLLTRGHRARPWVLAAAILLPLDLFCLQAFGRSLVVGGPERTQYGGPARTRGAWGQEAVVDALGERLPPASVVVVGSEHPYFNANLLSAYAARRALPLSFVHYGHMEGRLERVLARLAEKDATHILFVDGLPPAEQPPMVPGVDAALRTLIGEGALPFRPSGPIALGGGLKAELWERAGPIRIVAPTRIMPR